MKKIKKMYDGSIKIEYGFDMMDILLIPVCEYQHWWVIYLGLKSNLKNSLSNDCQKGVSYKFKFLREGIAGK
jgi:hypothetical protein